MEPRCPVCNHKEVNEINRDMVLKAMSSRKVAEKYSINHSSVNKHRPHITRNLALAVERRELSASDRLLEDTEMLWRETQAALEESKSAVKTMAYTEGFGKRARTVYKEYKDVGAVLSAIKVAHENRRLFGDATGSIRPPGQGGQVGVYLSIAMPRMDNTPPSIEATVLNTGGTQENCESSIDPPISTVFGLGQSDAHASLSPSPHAEPTTEVRDAIPTGRWRPGGRGSPPKSANYVPPAVKKQRRIKPTTYKRGKQAKEYVKEKIWGSPNGPKDTK